MNWRGIKIQSGVKMGLLGLMFFLTIGFVGKRQHDKVITNIDIRIHNHFNSYFIDKNDILNLITENGTKKIVGVPAHNLDLKEIENRVSDQKFVQNAEVYKDLQGSLVVNAHQSVPIARVVQSDGPDAYISDRGHVMPVSEKFTARVMVIGGDYTKQLVKRDLTEDSTAMRIFELLQFIRSDEFWKVQIAQLNINKGGSITFYPQVGNQVIEFGKAENIEKKFRKLKIFYEQILPQEGWNSYERVNLEYNNQIICE